MTNTERATSLYNILRRERERGFDDRAVIGGLDAFLERFSGDLAAYVGNSARYAEMSVDERSDWATKVVGRMRDAGVSVRSGSGQSPPAPKAAPTRSERPAPKRKAVPRKPPAPRRPLDLSDDVTLMKGVWQKLLPRLHKLDVNTVGDLVHLFPSRHNDFTNVRTVSQLAPGDNQTAILTVWEARETMLGRQKSTQAVLGDDTGNIRATWFNMPWVARQLKHGVQVVLSGKVNIFRGNLVFEAPEYEILDDRDNLVHTGRLVPVYPSTQGLSQRVLRSLVKRALDATIDRVDEFLPTDLLHRTGLIGLANAMRQIHYPDDWDAEKAAKRRLAFDELFLLQMSVIRRRNDWREENRGIPIPVDNGVIESFLGSLPFDLTGAQNRSLQEVLSDLRSDRAMSRLLQGDVGSGKTVVAAAAMLGVVRDGKQAALMAPTEILAEQHFLTICGLLSGTGYDPTGGYIQRLDVEGIERKVVVALLLGAHRKRIRDDLRSLMSAGMIDIVIGTHALIQEGVDIPNLALAVVDEQHRFGVRQRQTLREKGERPHLLAMSATPIPRSLSLTVYGDLDVSVIDEMPPGRQTTRTRFIENDRRDSAYAFIRKEIIEGRQAFVVCPLIEESEVIQTKAAQEEYARLSEEIYPEYSVGLLHGRMSLNEKEEVMDSFKEREIDVLVSTPVVEVGIDVPNATVMLIDGAERFGLSQLHQFRGRVGRGEYRGHCLLLSESPGAEALRRLKLLEHISDGFRLAEEDLKLRGPGDYLGTRQSGLPSLRVAQITDHDILSLARREASRLLDTDPLLEREEHCALAERLEAYQSIQPGELS
jgi:ATP-dependent DNA helicase RecG